MTKISQQAGNKEWPGLEARAINTFTPHGPSWVSPRDSRTTAQHQGQQAGAHLGHAAGSRGDAVQAEGAQALVVASKLALALWGSEGGGGWLQ